MNVPSMLDAGIPPEPKSRLAHTSALKLSMAARSAIQIKYARDVCRSGSIMRRLGTNGADDKAPYGQLARLATTTENDLHLIGLPYLRCKKTYHLMGSLIII